MQTGPLDFSLSLPRSVLFRRGCFRQAPDVVLSQGKRVLCVVSKTVAGLGEHWEPFLNAVKKQADDVLVFTTGGREPEAADVDAVLSQARSWNPDVVCGLGGGSTVDIAKAIAALIPNADGLGTADFMEGASERTAAIEADPLPFIAIPTTAGTGSEATRNSVISLTERKLKRSIRDPRMVAQAAIIDPELTVSVPADVTAYSGMDALTQLIESHISSRANPVTDALSLNALPPAFKALPRAFADGADREARTALSYAAFISGVCLGNAGLGAAHAVAPALGILYGVPHGKACAALLPFALTINRDTAEKKLAAIARAAGVAAQNDRDAVSGLIEKVEALCRLFDIPQRLGAFGVTTQDLPELCRYASGNSLRGNPEALSREALAELLAPFV